MWCCAHVARYAESRIRGKNKQADMEFLPATQRATIQLSTWYNKLGLGQSRARDTGLSHSWEYRPPYALGEQVIDKKVKKGEDPRPRSRPGVHGDLSGNAQLRKFADPGDARIYGSGRLILTVPVQAGFHGKLYNKNHAVEGLTETDVLYNGLEIHQAVLNSERPGQRRGVLNIVRGLLRGDVRANDAGDSEGPQKARWLEQVAEPFAEIEGRGYCRELI